MSTQHPLLDSFITRLAHKSTLFAGCIVALGFSVLALSACGGRSSGEMATDTKTNWLGNCDADTDCSAGLSCLCGICTRECDAEEACNGLAGAQCSAMSGCGDVGLLCAPPDQGADAAAPSADDGAGQSPDDDVDDEVPGDPVTPPSDDGEAADDDDAAPTPGPTEPGSEPTPDDGDAGAMPCPRPLDDYALLGEQCLLADFSCADYFSDECGCGCEGATDAGAGGELCGRPSSQYVALGDRCLTARFSCDEAGEAMFINDCGCGCGPVDDAGAPECDVPGRRYVATSPAQCAATLFMCVDGATAFYDVCGCGCQFDSDAGAACESDTRDYQSRSPEQCQVLDFICDEGTTYFGDECGCGCETQGETPSSCEPGDGSAVPAEVIELGLDSCAYSEDVEAASGLIESAEELALLFDACGATLEELAIDFAEKRLFVAVEGDVSNPRFGYAVQDAGVVHVGIEFDAWCQNAMPPAGIVAVELDRGDSSVTQDSCSTNVCAPL